MDNICTVMPNLSTLNSTSHVVICTIYISVKSVLNQLCKSNLKGVTTDGTTSTQSTLYPLEELSLYTIVYNNKITNTQQNCKCYRNSILHIVHSQAYLVQ